MWGALCFQHWNKENPMWKPETTEARRLKFQWLGLRVSALLGNPEITQSAKSAWHVMTSTAKIWRSLASAAQSDEHPAQGVGASILVTEVEEIELSVLPLAGTGFWCSQKPHSATKRFRRQQALWRNLAERFSEFSVLAAPLSSWAGLPIDSCRFRHDKTRTRDRICGMPKKTIVT